MDGMTLDERCAELKSQMLAERAHGNDRLVPGAATSVLTRPTPQQSRLRSDTKPSALPAVELRNPHPIVKAARAAKNDVPDEYGKMQFQRRGCVDIRVKADR
jgi:hypothetical protein